MSETEAEPPLLSLPAVHPATAKRVGVGLIVFGAWSFVSGVAELAVSFRTVVTEQHGNLDLSAPLICVAYWLAAWWALKGRRFIYPVIACLTAGAIGVLMGEALGAAGVLPLKLIRAYALHEETLFWGSVLQAGVDLVFYVWLLVEATRIPWPANLLARRVWLRPRAVFLYGAALGGLGVAAFFALMNSSWTQEAKQRAREQCGNGYDYRVAYYELRSVNGRAVHRAVVLAYNDDELRRVVLDWEN